MLLTLAGLVVATLSQGAPPEVAPMGADSDATPAEVERISGLDGGQPPPEPPVTAPVQPLAPEATADGGLGPIIDEDGISGRIGGQVRVSQLVSSAFPLDGFGTTWRPYPFEARLRVSPEVHLHGLGALVELDAAAGSAVGVPDSALVASPVPYRVFTPIELRQAYLEYRWASGLARIGQQSAQWGLGLVLNSGANDAPAGDFGQQSFGTLLYRAGVVLRPLQALGWPWRALETTLAADLVVRDSDAEYAAGDRVWQGFLAARLVFDADRSLGIAGLYRHARGATGGDGAQVGVFDATGHWAWSARGGAGYTVGFEVVGVAGTSTLTSATGRPDVFQVRQFGAALEGSARFGSLQLYLDWGYASGDQSPTDDRLDAFRFDRDYKVGLVLFDQVLGYQSARSARMLLDAGGAHSELAHVPTGGAVFQAWYLFPRLRYGLTGWFDLYGGPLFAFSTAALLDSASALTGLTHINYLGGNPGRYLGTELDVGAQARWRPLVAISISATLEAGLLLPGSAFALASGAVMGPVGTCRLRLTLTL